MKLSKAAKLVDKISNSTGIDLKRVLFSLKTFFQTDKDLVYEFVKEGGLAQLVELGKVIFCNLKIVSGTFPYSKSEFFQG